jgi:hypothetical protein
LYTLGPPDDDWDDEDEGAALGQVRPKNCLPLRMHRLDARLRHSPNRALPRSDRALMRGPFGAPWAPPQVPVPVLSGAQLRQQGRRSPLVLERRWIREGDQVYMADPADQPVMLEDCEEGFQAQAARRWQSVRPQTRCDAQHVSWQAGMP